MSTTLFRIANFAVAEQPIDLSPIRRGEARDIAAELISQALGGEIGPAIDGTPFRIAICPRGGLCSYLYFDRAILHGTGTNVEALYLGVSFKSSIDSDPDPIHDPDTFRVVDMWAGVFFGRRRPQAYWQFAQARSADRPAPGFLLALPIDPGLQPRSLTIGERMKFAQHNFKTYSNLHDRCRYPDPSPVHTAKGTDGANAITGCLLKSSSREAI